MESDSVINECSETTSILPTAACRCCLAGDSHKDMSAEYFWKGKREVYSEMLNDAFNITLAFVKKEGMNNSTLICEDCIVKLREAFTFKEQVLHAEETFKQHLFKDTNDITLIAEPVPDISLKQEQTESDQDSLDLSGPDDDINDKDDDDDDVEDEEPLINFSKNITIVDPAKILSQAEVKPKAPVKRTISQSLVPPPIKRLKVPDTKQLSRTRSTLKQILIKPASSKPQPLKTGNPNVLARKIVIKPQVPAKKIIFKQPGFTMKPIARPMQKIVVKPGSGSTSKGTILSMPSGNKLLIKKPLPLAPPPKPSTSKPKAPEKPIKVRQINIPRKNAEIVIRYSTAYPFKLPKQDMACVYCEISVPTPSMYKQHMETVHPIVSKEIKFRRWPTDESYVKVDITNLKCRLCDEPANDLNAIVEHLRGTHKLAINTNYNIPLQPHKFPTNSFNCLECDKSFYNLRALSRHTQSHYSRFPCDQCGKLYSTMLNLKHHFNRAHASHGIRCVKCKKQFPDHESKNQHLEKSDNCRQHICPICFEKFAGWQIKQNHMLKEHPEFKKSYSCTDCDKKFLSAMECRNHFRKAHDKSSSCALCGQGFNGIGSLKRHMTVHTKERNFQCSVCEKTFLARSSVNSHMRMHFDSRKFVCKLCDIKFNQKVSLKTHIKSQHPEYHLDI